MVGKLGCERLLNCSILCEVSETILHICSIVQYLRIDYRTAACQEYEEMQAGQIPFNMNKYVGSKLIIVEGLTGSGKSIMAHYIARQLQYNGISAGWVHEGEIPHPILRDFSTTIEMYMADMKASWAAYVDQVGSSDQVSVVEACFFNNLIDTLLAHDVQRSRIIQFGAELQALIAPLNPTLICLVQEDVANALEQNFNKRGDDFRDYVIEYATSTPLAQSRGWQGYEGMVQFWLEFVALTDELFSKYPGRKLKIDNSAGDWEDYKHQVLECLAIPVIPEQKILQTEATNLMGVYKDRQSGKKFSVQYEDGELTINVFLNVRSRLVRCTKKEFFPEGWPFEISFEVDNLGGTRVLRIGGRDVDYLALVGTIADKASAEDEICRG